ncbi:unnamed protein product, partial [Bubo scandiacus]
RRLHLVRCPAELRLLRAKAAPGRRTLLCPFGFGGRSGRRGLPAPLRARREGAAQLPSVPRGAGPGRVEAEAARQGEP